MNLTPTPDAVARAIIRERPAAPPAAPTAAPAALPARSRRVPAVTGATSGSCAPAPTERPLSKTG